MTIVLNHTIVPVGDKHAAHGSSPTSSAWKWTLRPARSCRYVSTTT
jgi:hypothetical protein